MNMKNFFKRLKSHIIQGVSVYVLNTNFQKLLFFLINFNVTGIFWGCRAFSNSYFADDA